MQCPDEGLGRLAADVIALFVALRLDVDLVEAEGVLVDQAVDALVVEPPMRRPRWAAPA